jgi:hypothetical protein|tara:strand:- start:54 stop:377 length:324 start_codon:yes stop_codon:yes gene_type:complete
MSELDHKFVLEQWKKLYLVDAYEDWDVEVSPDVKQDFATIALFLDFKTSKSSGEEKEIFEGIKKASLIILDFLEIQIIDNPEEKKIQLIKKESSRVRDEKLAKEIWG